MKLGTISKLLLVAALCPSPVALAQCENNITLVPLDSQGAASKSREFVRFKYSLSSSDSLLLWAHEDKGTTLGPYDTGFSVVRNGRELQRTTLKGLPEMRGEELGLCREFLFARLGPNLRERRSHLLFDHAIRRRYNESGTYLCACAV